MSEHPIAGLRHLSLVLALTVLALPATTGLAALLAWWLIAVIFGLADLPFGIEFAAVATVAGLGYGWIAWKSGLLWPAIALPCLINLPHLSLFSYPMLA